MTEPATATAERTTPGTHNGEASAYSWYVLGILVLVYVLNFVDRQILSILAKVGVEGSNPFARSSFLQEN
jgi:hypothetical protein